MAILSELITYLRRPVFTSTRVPITQKSMMDLTKLFGFTLILAILSVIFAGGLYALLSGGLPETSETYDDLSKGGQLVFLAVLIAPFTEELLFRSWLGRVWGVMIVMPVVLTIGAVLGLYSQNASAPAASLVGMMVVLGSLGLYLRRYFETKPESYKHQNFTQQIFPFVFWGTALVFALMHMSNYAEQDFQPLLILLVMPQFIVGVVLGFIRMRYGLLQAIGFHAVYNGVFVGLSYLS